MEKEYAQAIQSLLRKEDSKTVFEKLVAHLKATGRTKLLTGIKRELECMELRSEMEATKVEVAHKSDEHAALAEAKALGIEVAHAHVNPSLIRGWRARSGGTLVDRSGKRALIDLYRSII